ncbi:MAG: hypothetical protein IJ593_09825 [Lachnospiraceae bacterium]|nr:hypothetical protein [Lachnospiraceae bacterium]
MTGMLITNYNTDKFLLSKYNEGDKFIYESKKYSNISIQRLKINKFLNDKLFFENDNYIVLIEGVILNSLELAKEKNVKTFKDYIEISLKDDNTNFYNNLRGSFCGYFLNKNNNEAVAFTNHTGDRPLFYYKDDDKYIIASNIKFILDFLNVLGKKLTFNKNAVYYMITWGNMIDNSTYANEIKRLLPGEKIDINKNSFNIIKYYKFNRHAFDTSKMSDDEIVDKLDELFTKAVNLEYAKDKEYGYNSLAHLSSGLDCRMSNFIARELGYDNILNLTYTQSNSYDERIAKKMSADLGNESYIRYMNNPKFIYDVDKVVEKSGGVFIYIGMTNGLRCLEELNTDKIGVLHMGLIGDVILGTCVKSKKELYKKNYSGAYSKRIISKFKEQYDEKINEYEDYEMFYLNTCAFLCNGSFPIIYQDYTEFASPYMYKDFIDFCYALDVEKRINRYIYFKWIKTKHHEAGNYEWSGSHVKINSKFYQLIRILKRIPVKIMRFFGADINDMNPFNYWYKSNKDISRFIDTYIATNMNSEYIDLEMRNVLNEFLNGSTCLEKLQLMTALSSIKLYFGK